MKFLLRRAKWGIYRPLRLHGAGADPRGAGGASEPFGRASAEALVARGREAARRIFAPPTGEAELDAQLAVACKMAIDETGEAGQRLARARKKAFLSGN